MSVMIFYVDSKGNVDFRKPRRLRVGPFGALTHDGVFLVWVFSGQTYEYQQPQLEKYNAKPVRFPRGGVEMGAAILLGIIIIIGIVLTLSLVGLISWIF
jgi:hypothetical protein